MTNLWAGGVVAGVTGLIRGIRAVKTVKNEKKSLPFFTGGRGPRFLSTISAVKTVKNEFFFPFLPGGRPFFLYHIRGKNGKKQIFLFFLPFLPGGRPFFLYHIFFSTISAVKTVKNEIFLFLPFLPGGRPFFSTISAVKTVKNDSIFLNRFYRGGAPCFSTISAVKTVKNEFLIFFLPFLPGGRPFFLYRIRGKNGQKQNFSFFTVFTGGAPLFSLPYPR